MHRTAVDVKESALLGYSSEQKHLGAHGMLWPRFSGRHLLDATAHSYLVTALMQRASVDVTDQRYLVTALM